MNNILRPFSYVCYDPLRCCSVTLLTYFIIGFGCRYSFQTPEGWNIDDQYRSLCYMRPLAIWAMQWALTRPKLFKLEMKCEDIEEDYLYARQHAGFSKVANLLKLPKEEAKGLVQILYEFTCRRLVQ